MNIEERKIKLLEEKRRIEEEITKHKNPPDFGSDVDDFDEETDEAEETANTLALIHELKEQLHSIEKNIEELENEK